MAPPTAEALAGLGTDAAGTNASEKGASFYDEHVHDDAYHTYLSDSFMAELWKDPSPADLQLAACKDQSCDGAEPSSHGSALLQTANTTAHVMTVPTSAVVHPPSIAAAAAGGGAEASLTAPAAEAPAASASHDAGLATFMSPMSAADNAAAPAPAAPAGNAAGTPAAMGVATPANAHADLQGAETDGTAAQGAHLVESFPENDSWWDVPGADHAAPDIGDTALEWQQDNCSAADGLGRNDAAQEQAEGEGAGDRGDDETPSEQAPTGGKQGGAAQVWFLFLYAVSRQWRELLYLMCASTCTAKAMHSTAHGACSCRCLQHDSERSCSWLAKKDVLLKSCCRA